MSLPVPLMFINGPPVYEKVLFQDDESTSVFVKYVDDTDDAAVVHEELADEEHLVDPLIMKKLQRVKTSFGQEIYKRLTFILDDERIEGNVTKLDGNTVFVKLAATKDTIIAIELSTIRNILWRGKPLSKN